MKIVEKKTGNTNSVFLADTEDSVLWVMARHRDGEATISGFAGNAFAGKLAEVYPFTFNGGPAAGDLIKQIGQAVMAHVGGLQVRSEREAVKGDIADQLSQWSSFLSGKTVEAGKLERRSDMVIEPADQQRLVAAGVLKLSGGVMRVNTKSALKVGSAISGFDAINVQSAVAAAIPAVKVPQIDIEKAREALKAVFRPSSNAVSWYGTSGPHEEDRPQAARGTPVLAGMIADQFSLARAVDNRSSIHDALSEASGLGKGGLKRLQKITAPFDEGKLFEDGNIHGEDALGLDRTRRIPVTGAISLETAMRHLRALPADRIPQDNESWKLYADILGAIAIPLENALGIPVERTLGACSGDWKAFHATLARAADFTPEAFDRRTMALSTIDSIQVIDDFSRSAIMPQILTSIQGCEQEIPPVSHEFLNTSFRIATDMIVGKSKNVAGGLFETGRRYTGRITALMDLMQPETPEDAHQRQSLEWSRYGTEAFPQLLEPYHASNGLTIYQLTNWAEMRQESTRLSHCVGRLYLNSARDHSTFILSVQSPDRSISHSTIELSRLMGESLPEVLSNFRVIQHRARGNGTPSPAAMAAAQEWLADLKGGRLAVNTELSNRWRNWRLTSQQNPGVAGAQAQVRVAVPVVNWASALENHWDDGETRQALWREWGTIIGGNLGKAQNAEYIYREASARKLLADMSPMTARILEEQAIARKREQEAAQAAPAPEA